MRELVVILAVGSRGDVQPYIALGKGLQAAGYNVRLATHADFREFVTAHGLEFREIGGNSQALMQTDLGRDMVGGGTNPIPFIRGLRKSIESTSGEVLKRSIEACRGASAIIYSIFALPGPDIAEQMGIPSFPAFLQPMTRTRYFPIQPPPIPVRSGIINLTGYIAAQQAFGQLFRGMTNSWRTGELGLKPMSRAGLYSQLDTKHAPVLYGFSPTIVRKPPDWGPWIHVTGYWFLDRLDDYKPPDNLMRFLEAGEPPVYVGFGSMAGKDPERSARIVVQALQQSEQRGLLLTGWGGLRSVNLPDSVFCIDSAPHDWLFPRMAAIAHHGGSGTTGAAVRAGVPSFAMPFFGDQYFWAARLASLGVGPKPVPQDKLSVESLARAIHTAVTDPKIKARAGVVGERVRAEKGVDNAVHAIGEGLSRWSASGRV